MTMCGAAKHVFRIWLVCLHVYFIIHGHLLLAQSATNRTSVYPFIPTDCSVFKGEDGVSLRCYRASFHEILRTIRMIGEELVEITAKQCTPRPTISLNASCFANNTNLNHILLSACGVEHVAVSTFTELPHLRYLGLEASNIGTFTSETFTGLQNLVVLNIKGNDILTLTKNFFKDMKNLSELYIGYNQIMMIGNDTFQVLTNLKTLGLSNNKIQSITARMFSGLNNLDNLDLSYNRIVTIKKGMFKAVKNITYLSLAGNAIMVLGDAAFSDLTKLKSLSLENMPNLLSSYLYPKPNFFAGLRNLKSLDLSEADMSQLEDSDISVLFKDQAYSLKELYLVGTQFINPLLRMIKDLEVVKILDLSENDIGYIKPSSLPKLLKNGTVDLTNNKIAYVDEDAFETMQNYTVQLLRNPLDCSCKHASFSRWLRSDTGAVVEDREYLVCGSPIDLYGKRVMDYDPYWWQCSEYVPLVALIFIVGFFLIIALILLIIYCNWINLKHWLLERQIVSKPNDDEQDMEPPTDRSPLLNPAMCRNSLRQGKTGAYIIHDIYERPMLDWVNKYVENQLFGHAMKITLQFPAGPEVTPLWKQVKDFSFQVNAFLVLVTDKFLENHWPEIAEKSGVENIMKCVFVLHGKKKSELPKEMRKLPCQCLQWPETGTRFTTLERERDQFWKQLRLALKGTT